MDRFKLRLLILACGLAGLPSQAMAGEFSPAISCHKAVLPLLRRLDQCLHPKRKFVPGPKAPVDQPPSVDGVADGKTLFPIGQSSNPPEEVYLIESQRLRKNGFYVITDSDAYFKELTLEEVSRGLFTDIAKTISNPLVFHYQLLVPRKRTIRLSYAPGPTDGRGNLVPAQPTVMPSEVFAKKKSLGLATPDFKAVDLSQSSLGGGDRLAHQALNEALAAEVKKLRVLSEGIPPEKYRSYEGCLKDPLALESLRVCAKIERGSKEMRKDAEKALSILAKIEDALLAARGVLPAQRDPEGASPGGAGRANGAPTPSGDQP